MSRELIEQLKRLKHDEVTPRQEWLQKNREILLSQIKNTVAEKSGTPKLENIWNALSIFVPRQMVFNVVRPIAVLLVVALVASSGWVTTVDAAYNALPGDWLYPAKRVMEKGQLTMASVVGGRDAETKTRAEFVKRRAVEVKQILKNDVSDKVAKVTQVVNEMKQEMKTVNDSLDAMKTSPGAVQVAIDVKKETEQIKDVMHDVKVDLLASSNTSTMKEVAEIKDLAKDTSMKAVEVMVVKHMEGDNSMSSEEVKKEIQSTLTVATEEAVTAKQTIDTAKTVVDTVKSEAKEAAKSVDAVVNTSTQAFKEKIADAAEAAKEAVTKTDKVQVTSDKTANTVQGLLDKGDLSSALSAVKVVTEATKEVEKISDQTLTQVQTVLPIVGVVKEILPLPADIKPTILIPVTTTPATSTHTATRPIMITPVITTVPITTTKR